MKRIPCTPFFFPCASVLQRISKLEIAISSHQHSVILEPNDMASNDQKYHYSDSEDVCVRDDRSV